MKTVLNLICLIVVLIASVGLVRDRLDPDAGPIRCDGDVCPVCGEEFRRNCSPNDENNRKWANSFFCGECGGSYRVNLECVNLRRDGDKVWDFRRGEWFVPGERRSLLERARRLLHMEE